jgi:hypothetical protein
MKTDGQGVDQGVFPDEETTDGLAEKRLHPRKPFRLYVTLTCDRVTGQKQARDISLSGIFVEGVDNIAPGKIVQLSLPFSNQGCHIKLKGKVVRATPDGIGIHFDIFSIDIG